MDPFEVRMQFLSLLHRLNASQQSIQKVVAYALKYFSRCGEDLWDCIVEECEKGSLNIRINILYLLDSLCEASLLSKASFGHGAPGVNSSRNVNLYVDFVERDLAKMVDYVVPPGREGLINLMSAVQILENWRNKRVINPQKVEDVLSKLDAQKSAMHDAASSSASAALSGADPPYAEHGSSGGDSLTFSRVEIFKRIEEDRERHKRLRERRWVQPLAHGGAQTVPVLASFAPLPVEPVLPTTSHVPLSSETPNPVSDAGSSAQTKEAEKSNENVVPTPTKKQTAPELPLDIEFDNAWETTSDWNEDDEEAIAEENALCFPNAATRFDSSRGPTRRPPGPSSTSISSSIPSTSLSRAGPAPMHNSGFAPSLPAHVARDIAMAKQVITNAAAASARAPAPPQATGANSTRPIRIDRSRIFSERRDT